VPPPTARWPLESELLSVPTLLTAALMIAPPGTSGAATPTPVATALAAVARPSFMRAPKSDFGVCRSSVTFVFSRTGVRSMRVGPPMESS
jgi:hypothetical protein